MRDEELIIDYPVSEAFARHYQERGYRVPNDLIRRREPIPTPQQHADDIARTLELYLLREEVATMRLEKQELESYAETLEARLAKIEKRLAAADQTRQAKPKAPQPANAPIPIRQQGGIEL